MRTGQLTGACNALCSCVRLQDNLREKSFVLSLGFSSAMRSPRIGFKAFEAWYGTHSYVQYHLPLRAWPSRLLQRRPTAPDFARAWSREWLPELLPVGALVTGT